MARKRTHYKRYDVSPSNRFKNKSTLTTDYYTAKVTLSELQQVRRSLAKTANQRLVRLERTDSAVTGENYASYGAAEIAKHYLKQQGDRNRFSEQIGYSDDLSTLRYEIAALQSFLTAKSSTVAGQKDIERKRIQTLQSGKNALTGVKRRSIESATNKDFYVFLNSNVFKDYIKIVDSDKMIELYDEAKEHTSHEKILDELDKIYQEFEKSKKEVTLQAITEGLQSLK